MRMGLLLITGVAALFATPATAETVIPVAPFSRVTLQDGGYVVLKHGAVQRVTMLKGSTEYSRFTIEHGRELRIEGCKRHCPSGYELEVEIVSPNVEAIGVSDGGEFYASGDFPARDQLNVAVSDGGILNARAIPAAQINAAVSDGGVIKIAPIRQLNAAVTDGGQITYWGNPSVQRAVIDGGVIRRHAD